MVEDSIIEEAEETEEVVPEVEVPEKPSVEDNYEDDDEDEDDDYDYGDRSGKVGIGQQLKIWWGKAQKKMDAVADKTDKMIGNIAN